MRRTRATTAALIVIWLTYTSAVPSFWVCGNFCGPGWCGDNWWHEGYRNTCERNGGFNVAPFRGHFLQSGHADTCCRDHDVCCSDPSVSVVSGCNAKMVQCLDQNPAWLPIDASCSFRALAMRNFMNFIAIRGYCCGSACPTNSEPPVYMVYVLVSWYAFLLFSTIYIQIRAKMVPVGHNGAVRASLRTMFGLQSLKFFGGAHDADRSVAIELPHHPPDASSKDNHQLNLHDSSNDSELALKKKATIWRLAWPWAMPIFLAVVTWTQVLNHTWSREVDVKDELGLLAPPPAVTVAHDAVLFGNMTLSADSLLERRREMLSQTVWWRYVTYMFAHNGASHLVNNALLQLSAGVTLEMLHGSLRVGCIYMLSGITAALAFAAIPRQEPSLLVGASAACLGLVGAQAANCILNWELMPFRRQRVLVLVGYAGFYLAFALVWPSPVATHTAHGVGVIQGFLTAFALLRNFVPRPWELRARRIATGLALSLVVILLACTAAGTGGSVELRWMS